MLDCETDPDQSYWLVCGIVRHKRPCARETATNFESQVFHGALGLDVGSFAGEGSTFRTVRVVRERSAEYGADGAFRWRWVTRLGRGLEHIAASSVRPKQSKYAENLLFASDAGYACER